MQEKEKENLSYYANVLIINEDNMRTEGKVDFTKGKKIVDKIDK